MTGFGQIYSNTGEAAKFTFEESFKLAFDILCLKHKVLNEIIKELTPSEP